MLSGRCGRHNVELHASATPHASGLCRFVARQTRLALASLRCCRPLSSTAVAAVDCLPFFAVSHVSLLCLVAPSLCFMLLQDSFALAVLARALLCHGLRILLVLFVHCAFCCSSQPFHCHCHCQRAAGNTLLAPQPSKSTTMLRTHSHVPCLDRKSVV